jgi:replicative DNA helicase
MQTERIIDRAPPNDTVAEAAILGAVLIDNAQLARLVPLLRDEDFYTNAHRAIWQAMVAISTSGGVIDHLTLAAALREAGTFEQVGGALKLSELTNGIAAASGATAWASIVRDAAVARRVIYAAQEIVARGFASRGDVVTFAADARAAIVEACEGAQRSTTLPATLDVDMGQVWNDVTTNVEPEGLIKTGISSLDRIAGGLWPGMLTIVAGRPGMGKSAVGQNIATSAALAGKRVLFLTLEDIRYFVAVRQLARFAKLDNTRIAIRSIVDAEQSQLLHGYNAACGLPLWVDDTPAMRVQDIRAKVLAHRDAHGLDLLVIDHLLEIEAEGESETAIVSRAARGVRDLVKELHIPGVLLHQLNRQVEQRAGKIPTLADLKQSGRVEEVARAVWFLYRPGYYEPDGEDRKDVQCIIAKANHGRTGMARLWADLSTMYVRGWELSDGDFPGARPESEKAERPTGRWQKADGTPAAERPRSGYDY